MKITRTRYQKGNIRKVPRAHGFAWQFRFYSTDANGERKQQVQTFDGAVYKTKSAVKKAIEPHLKTINETRSFNPFTVTLGTVIDRYLKEELPQLKHSTQCTNKSLIELHIRPKWGNALLDDIEAEYVKQWLDSLPFGPASRVRARNLISKLLKLAMFWRYMPQRVNPMALITIKGATKRQKALTILSPDQFKDLVTKLPAPYNQMVLVCGCLGLRVSEMLALKWTDFDWDENTVTIQRVFTHGKIQDSPKSESSAAPLPVFPALAALLKQRQENDDNEFEYVFASPKTGTPYSDATILQNYIKPAATSLKLGNVGWHTFRHSYKTWLAGLGTPVGTMKDLMRHSDISTTMEVYGKTLTRELRQSNELVAASLF
jgi:integrase